MQSKHKPMDTGHRCTIDKRSCTREDDLFSFHVVMDQVTSSTTSVAAAATTRVDIKIHH